MRYFAFIVSDPRSPETGPQGSPPDRLDSWKDIAAYLKRDVSTVQRWEKREGMPVHRHIHDKLGSVYAFPAELDQWARGRRPRNTDSARSDTEPAGAADRNDREPEPSTRRRRVLWLTSLTVTLIALAGITVLLRSKQTQNPLSNARFVRLTDFEGTEQAAAISRDGRFVAFLADRDGPVDVWLTQVGSREFHNLTGGRFGELINPDIRTIGFSPDGALVTFWVRSQTASAPPDISVWAVSTLGGEPRPYLPGTAEFDWSSDGSKLV